MKKILLITFTLFHLIGFAQNFTGDYRSFKTSYKDESSTENNFIEESEFRIGVFIDENKKEGVIIIQDPRIPKKLLAYNVIEYIGKLEDKGIVSYLYKCETEHLENPKEVILTFYYPVDKKLSLMVYNKESSQVFFDLKINNK